MIKNYNFNISEEEKKQILSLHESRTKRHYLINEQRIPFNDEIEKKFVKQIQAQLGFSEADRDGKLGPKTYAAITAKLTGTSGTSGTGGVTGTSGTSGTGGVTGTSGTSGTGGVTGTSKNKYLSDDNF